MSFIQVDQECVVETGTMLNNTGEDMGETGENTVPLSNNNNRPLMIEKIIVLVRIIFQLANAIWSFSEDMFSCILKQFHIFIPDDELEDTILKYNPISSNVPPPAPHDGFLRGVSEENHKYSQMQEDKLLQKMQQKV